MLNIRRLALLFTILSLFPFAALSDEAGDAEDSKDTELQIEPVGLDEVSAKALEQLILDQPSVKSRLQGRRYRVISADLGENAGTKDDTLRTDEGRYRLFVYDYSNDRALMLSGDQRLLRPADIAEVSDEDLTPSEEEYAEARQIIEADAQFGDLVKSGEAQVYEAMPPVLDLRANEGDRKERVITVGILPDPKQPLEKGEERIRHEIVGINLSRGTLIRFPNGAPPTSLATRDHCGFPNAGQANTARGVTGQADLTIRRGGITVWQMRVVRPSASSGAKGSAIDLRNIRYRGKLVLAQAHVPILNVHYTGNACGPYRDWQYSESPFTADGTLLASGIRRTVTPPQTIFESNRDSGNFRGVAVHDYGNRAQLISELSASWYRYISEFSFYDDGTIKPVFKFSAVDNSCVCKAHHHNVYWRFDFDIGTASPNVTQVSADGQNWRNVGTETRQIKSAENKFWRVLNPTTGSGYTITPGADDGVADSYDRGDVWALRYRSGQIDDGSVRTSTAANIDAFATGESILNADSVFWYAGHFGHVPNDETHPHQIGPTLKPFGWAPLP